MRYTTRVIGTMIAVAALGMAIAAEPIQAAKLKGKGAFAANGKGIATLSGSGKFTIEGRGDVLVIAGKNDKIEVSGFGGERIEGNKHFYTGAGKVTVTGTDISVKLDGNVDKLRAIGNGSALLVGKGDYSVGKLVGHWSSGGNTIWFIDKK